MSIQAFGTRRVIESLRAIGSYLEQAVETAEGIPPGEVVRLDLEDIPNSVSPRLTSVHFPNLTRKITLPEHDGDTETTVDLTVAGENLENPKVFKLVGVDPGTPFFTSTTFTSSDEDGFVVTMVITEPSAGLYDAKFVNDAGQSFVLNRACRIKKPRSGGGGGADDSGGLSDVEKTELKSRGAKAK